MRALEELPRRFLPRPVHVSLGEEATSSAAEEQCLGGTSKEAPMRDATRR